MSDNRNPVVAYKKDEVFVGILRDWKNAGFTPREAYRWGLEGFSLDQALGWREAGENLDEAVKWVQAFGPSSCDEYASSEWRKYRFTPEEAKRWNERYFDPAIAAKWRDEGFSAGNADCWIGRKFDLQEARKWVDCGFRDPDTHFVLAWKAIGVAPGKAAELSFKGYTPKDQAEKVDPGLFIETAVRSFHDFHDEEPEWQAAGIGDIAMSQWVLLRFSLPAALAWEKIGVSPMQAAEIRSQLTEDK
jgi:hypothetical protein